MIISNELVNKTEDYLIVQITSKYNNDDLSVNIEDSVCLKPLQLDSYIRIHKIFTIHKSLVLSKITSIHYNASQLISDKNLLDQFKKVEQLPENKKLLVKEFLDAFLMKADLQKQLAV